jgi:hypothetical protein
MSTNAWLGVIAWLLAFLIFGEVVVVLTVLFGGVALAAQGVEGWQNRRKGARRG